MTLCARAVSVILIASWYHPVILGGFFCDNPSDELLSEALSGLGLAPAGFGSFVIYRATGSLLGVSITVGEFGVNDANIRIGNTWEGGGLRYDGTPTYSFVQDTHVTALMRDTGGERGFAFRANFQLAGMPASVSLWDVDEAQGKQRLLEMVEGIIAGGLNLEVLANPDLEQMIELYGAFYGGCF